MDEIGVWLKDVGLKIGDVANTSERYERAARILYTWKDCFATSVREIQATDLVMHHIPLQPSAKPFRGKIPVYTQEERNFIREMIPQLEAAGIIVRCESPWAATTKFPRKPTGKLRMVHVYCQLNKQTAKTNYPTPRIETVLDTIVIATNTVFFGADAAHSYWGILTHPNDVHKTAFVVPEGQFAYLRMGQGLTGGVHTYSSFSDVLWGSIPAPDPKPVVVGIHDTYSFMPFIDDNFGGSPSFDTLAEFLMNIYFPRLDWGRACLNPAKSVFFVSKIDLLSFSGSAAGLTATADRIRKFGNYLIPASEKELRTFVGMTPYYRRLIPGRAAHCQILITSVREDGSIRWEDVHQKSFDYIKSAVSENVVYGGDENVQWHMATDASKEGCGGVLFQLVGMPPGTVATSKLRSRERVVCFMSQRFAPTETRYTTTEREALSVVRNLREVRHRVLGSPYPLKVYTDHQSLSAIINSDTPGSHGRIARWQDKIQEFTLDIHHVPGRELLIADGMSRLPTRCMDPPLDVDDAISHAVEADGEGGYTPYLRSPWYGDVLRYKFALQENASLSPERRRYVKRLARRMVTDGQGGLYYVEADNNLAACVLEHDVRTIIESAHDLHGHFSIPATMRSIVGKHWWPTRSADITSHVRTCDTCQRIAPLRLSNGLRPIVQMQPGDMVGIDYLGPITPATEGTGNAFVLLIVDYFSRFVVAKAYPTATSANAYDLYANHYVPIMGHPLAVYSDRGSHFTGGRFPEYLEQSHVRHILASTNSPSSVGLAERFVQKVSRILRAMCVSDPTLKKKWDALLPEIVWTLNTQMV